MLNPTDDNVDAQSIGSISALRSRFEALQANSVNPVATSSSPVARTIQTRTELAPSAREDAESAQVVTRHVDDEDKTSSLSASSSTARSSSRGPPPPRPTSKKPPLSLRDRRRSSEDVLSDSGSQRSWTVGAVQEITAPSPPAITIKDEDDASPTYSGGGVAALRARFHGSNAAAPWNNAPPVTGPKSPLILRSHAPQSDTSSSPAIPISETVSRHTSRDGSPDGERESGATFDRRNWKITENGNHFLNQAPGSGRVTPLRSRTGSLVSERSQTSNKSMSGLSSPAVSPAVGETATTEMDSLSEKQVSKGNVPTIPSRASKPVILPRSTESDVQSKRRSPADTPTSESILSTSPDSPVSALTEEPEDSPVAVASGTKIPPPIPPNKPTLSTVKALSLPPRLPARQKTGGQIEDLNIDRTVPDLPLRPPIRKDLSVAVASSPRPSRSRAVTISNSASYGSLPTLTHLPPPSRHTTPQASRISSRRVSQDEVNSSDEDVEIDDSEVPASLSSSAPATTALKRALDEYPDMSRASRRLPDFTPRQLVSSTHTIHCFAVSGHKLCVGHHNVKVYDITLSETKPVMTVELRSTGLEFRGKDARLTAMSFRSVSSDEKEGRFLWCGTTHGHVWELDTITGEVTDTKAGLHGAAVAYIFRYKEWMLTLDEVGKLHVFGPFSNSPISGATDDPRRSALWRTIRTSDKTNFATMIGHQLWTSSGPTTRSTTNSSLRGPTIRIFEPVSDGSMAGKTVFTTEWTGSVTSAAVIPFQPDVVYLGHEGGFVSIFSRKDLTCLKVLKISPSDVLALEGVGDRLWVGARSGIINVYNVESQPWVATNSWLAHPDHAIIKIYVDPTSIKEDGRYCVWSWARDSIHAWDGMLSEDWIESTVTERERDYCSFRDLRALICSWNIGSCKPTDLSGIPENANFLTECLNSVDSPDIIVFGLQEVIDLENKKLTAKTVFFGGKSKPDGSKSTGDKVTSAYRHWCDKLVSAVRLAMPPTCPYVVIYSENLVGLLSIVFAKSELKASMKDVALTTVKRGLNGIYGNKGAIAARFVIDDSSICFINVHLAAGQRQKSARNADLAAIFEDKAVFPPSVESTAFISGGNGSAILDHENVFLSGDLNYRIDQRRDTVISNVNTANLRLLLEHDQLLKEMRTNSSFRLRYFTEAPITFAPTYKYEPYSTEYDMSAKMRVPAWCDRVLYRTRDATRVECLNYKRYEANVSDHRPISASFRVTVKSIDPHRYADVRGTVREEWRKEEAMNLEKLREVTFV